MDSLVKFFVTVMGSLPPVVSALIIGSVIVNVVLWKEYSKMVKSRDADTKAMAAALTDVAATNREVARSIDHRNQITDQLSRSIDNVAVTLQLQSQTITHTRDSLLAAIDRGS